MFALRVSPQWLHSAFSTRSRQAKAPVVAVRGTELSVTIFPKDVAAMRTVTVAIPESGTITFFAHEEFRSFVASLLDFHDILITGGGDGTVKIVCESPNCALQHTIGNIELTDDLVLPTTPDDICLQVPTHAWLILWKSIPLEGSVEIFCKRETRSLALKHSNGKWVAAVFCKDKPSAKRSFSADAGIIRDIMSMCSGPSTFSSVVFMKCGVMQFVNQDVSVFLAPSIPA
mgnify:CR=1 FL=1